MSLPIIVSAAVAVVVLIVGGLATPIGPWYANLRKPSWQPPNWVFGPVWTTIAVLAVGSAVLAWMHATSHAERTRIIALFAINAVLHMAWSPLFFTLRRPDWALIEVPFLWLSIVALMAGLAPISPLSAWLFVPYLAWVSVAAVLNLTIVRLNGPFRRVREA